MIDKKRIRKLSELLLGAHEGGLATHVDPALFPEYSTVVSAAMSAETEAFAMNVTFDGDGHYPALMLSSYSFINDALASFYGVSGVTGSALRKVDLDPFGIGELAVEIRRKHVAHGPVTPSATSEARNMRRPRWMRDRAVPIGTPVASAICS